MRAGGESPSKGRWTICAIPGCRSKHNARRFSTSCRGDPLLVEALARVRALALPDWLVVSGALYNSVWNQLTGKPSGYGIKDVDLFYFDESDLSYEAEDGVIRRAAPAFAGLPLPVEVRNQARVHLWYPLQVRTILPALYELQPLAPLFRLEDPCGRRRSRRWQLDWWRRSGSTNMSARITPNRVMDNQQTHA